MKIRKGFVSNSSSSSFLLVFEKRPDTWEEVHKIMFGTDREFGLECYGDGISSYAAAKDVWGTIANQNPMTDDKIKEELSHGYLAGQPEYPYKAKWWSRSGLDEIIEYEQKMEIFNARILKELKSDQEESLVFMVEYEDHTTFGSIMEHGNVFSKMRHLQICNH